MHAVATAWNFAPTDNRLAALLKLFGSSDQIAPFDADVFGKRAGELIRKAAIPNPPPMTEVSRKTKGVVEFEANPENVSLLSALHNVPRSDRLTMLAAAAATTSLLIAAGAILSES
jgi:hypothetical protein